MCNVGCDRPVHGRVCFCDIFAKFNEFLLSIFVHDLRTNLAFEIIGTRISPPHRSYLGLSLPPPEPNNFEWKEGIGRRMEAALGPSSEGRVAVAVDPKSRSIAELG